ncbi:hypothetical protein [Rhodococcus qingshengii]|uniref:hypothetical protein n=1 Tax=Rhodococcus qingshengii TaxID=334542 RepID=UPI001C5D4808|nr:hypothetical protein [Rhodococcus qingshengii]MBW4813189.1 hypothetical protein [Rhodococcus qingshengii]
MGVLSAGHILLAPFRIKTSRTLDQIRDDAQAFAYPATPQAGSRGFGSTFDDHTVLGPQVPTSLNVGRPRILDADGLLPRRLRLRLYWHTQNRSVTRVFGPQTDWRQTHSLNAVDITIFDNPIDDVRTAIVSTRDRKVLLATIFPKIQELVEAGSPDGSLETDSLPESLDPDFFRWLLFRSQDTKELSEDVTLTSMWELASTSDFGGASFTEQTALERIELAAAVAVGRRNFGPAKVSLAVDNVAKWLRLQLHLDGSFSVNRDSLSNAPDTLPHTDIGFWLAEHVSIAVLPKLRDAHNSDSHWRTEGQAKFTRDAIEVIVRTLGALGIARETIEAAEPDWSATPPRQDAHETTTVELTDATPED